MIEWKETELGRIPTDWDINILNNVCSKITDGSHFSPKESPDEQFRIATVKNMLENDFDLKNCKTISKNDFDFLVRNGCKAEKGDVLFSKDGSIGNVIYFNKDYDLTLLSSIAIFKPNLQYITGNFLSYYLKSNIAQYQIRKNFVSGSALPRVVLKDIKNFKVILPKLPEQKRISRILSVLDNKIDLLRRQNETLEAIAQTLFKRWFVEFEFPDENGLPYKSFGGKMVSSELGEMPEGWRVGKINEISTISTGKGLKRAEYIEKGSYPVYGANGEMCRTNSFLFDEKLIITGRVGTLGNIYIVNGKMWISDNVLILKPEEKFFYFTYFAMKRINFQSLNRGSTQPLITQTDLKIFEIIIPGEKLVDKFDLFSLGLFSKIENNMGQIDHLTKIRDILLPKLMSGQIRVK